MNKAMQQGAEKHFKQPGGITLLWVGLFAGPVAWALDQQIKYMWLTYICSTAGVVMLHVVTLMTLLLAGLGAYLSWRSWRRAGRELPDGSGGIIPRTRFMAAMGVALSALFALIIIAQWIPAFFFNPCERGA